MCAIMRILVEKSLEGRNILNEEREISSLLESRGFPQEEIYDALSWLQQIHNDWGEGGETLQRGRRGRAVRVMHPEERLAFTPAAQGLIHLLHSRGAIDDYLREEIIQRCIDLAEEEIDLEVAKTVTLLVLFKEHRDALGETVLKILDEDKSRLMN